MRKNLSGFLKILSIYNKDPDRKSYTKTLYEATRCMIQEKEFPIHYFTNLLFKKHTSNYLDYIGFQKSSRIKKDVLKSNNILDDKILFQKFIEENNIPGPVCLAQIKNGHFIIGNFSEKINSNDRLISLLNDLLHTFKISDSIFIKPSEGMGGGGTYKINKESLHKSDYINTLITDLQKNNYIIQEVVVQHELMNRLNASSLNTIRIHSYRKPNGEFGVASALSRMGYGGSHVDNITAGGIFVPVNLDTGRLEKYGYNFMVNGGRSYTFHPDTKTVFEGFELPYFSQSLELVRHAASFFENKIIGWDIAITVNGPILIEGNHKPHLVMAQTACGGFRNHPVYKELFKEYL